MKQDETAKLERQLADLTEVVGNLQCMLRPEYAVYQALVEITKLSNSFHNRMDEFEKRILEALEGSKEKCEDHEK